MTANHAAGWFWNQEQQSLKRAWCEHRTLSFIHGQSIGLLSCQCFIGTGIIIARSNTTRPMLKQTAPWLQNGHAGIP